MKNNDKVWRSAQAGLVVAFLLGLWHASNSFAALEERVKGTDDRMASVEKAIGKLDDRLRSLETVGWRDGP